MAKGPNNLTLKFWLIILKSTHLPSNKYWFSISWLIVSSYISPRSGWFTVAPQPKYSLNPTWINGEPGKVPPIIFKPSSLLIWASYQATGPVRGWCELMTNKVSLFADRFFETTKAFDPEGLKWDLTDAIRGWWDKEFVTTSDFSSSDNKSINSSI